MKLKAINPNTCNLEDTAIKTIRYFKDQIVVGEGGEICAGTTFQLSARGGNLYQWTTEDHVTISSASSPVVKPAHTTQYFVTATDINKCVRTDTVLVTVLDASKYSGVYLETVKQNRLQYAEKHGMPATRDNG